MNIQQREVRELQEKHGNKPCNHQYPLDKEYILGAATGDYVCSNCGKTGWGRDWNKKK